MQLVMQFGVAALYVRASARVRVSVRVRGLEVGFEFEGQDCG